MRRLLSISLAAILAAISTAAFGAEIKCSNIDAKAHYDSRTTAATTETGKACTISVGGASANSKTASITQPLARCLQIPLSRYLERTSKEKSFELIIALVVATTPTLSFDRASTLDFRGNLDSCLYDVSRLLNSTEPAFDSKLHQEARKYRDRITSCLNYGNYRNYDFTCERMNDNTLRIFFQSSFGNHALFIPFQ